MKVRVNRLHHPVEVLGFGRRLALWLQGCSIGCPGCASHDTWDPSAGFELSVDELVGLVDEAATSGLDGLTVTGGEPFDQAAALLALAAAVGGRRTAGQRPFDVLVYSGRELEEIVATHGPDLDGIDALVTGPYRAAAAPGSRWRGSDNQRLVPLTDLGRTRYAADDRTVLDQRLQVDVSDGRVWIVGIPRPGDLRRMERRLVAQGIRLEDVSWRP